MKKLLITDLDDTLYDWIGYFIPAFYTMLHEICKITGIDRERLINEYREIHQKYDSVEYPVATTLELPSIKRKYSRLSSDEVKSVLDEAFNCFNSVRKRKLKLYDGVLDTIESLSNRGVIIIGYTESAWENGFHRLKKLGISQYFKYVYSAPSKNGYTDKTIKYINGKKPNVESLLNICKAENCTIHEAVYVGDSLTKDVYMAKQAGIVSVWVNYPKEKNNYYSLLVDITSWTDEDFRKEAELKKQYDTSGMEPDFTISNFTQLLPIVMEE